MMQAQPWTVVDLFCGGGGASAGFARRGGFRIAGAVDAEVGKPSGGSSGCNGTFEANLGIMPLARDIRELAPAAFAAEARLRPGEPDVLISCSPCTGFSRAVPANHSEDADGNILLDRTADYAVELRPALLFVENAREMMHGAHAHHHRRLVRRLRAAGYHVRSQVHVLTRFGLPQVRERALVVASRIGEARTLPELWQGWTVRLGSVTVRTALARLAEWADGHPEDETGTACPGMGRSVAGRIAATPMNGGGWIDVARNPRTRELLTADCRARWERGAVGSHPDVYGRMVLDRPAPTIKRECSHVGNGRYSHPIEDRLLTVREMATLQGFPFDYRFPARAVASRYAHIGDAVPPLVSFQLAALADWMFTDARPVPESWILPRSTLRLGDLARVR